jgi:hypothetical protein
MRFTGSFTLYDRADKVVGSSRAAGTMDTTYNINGSFKPATRRFADLDGPDFYPTPRWATFALIENERFRGDIWECACGDGAMSEVLEEGGRRVESSDLYDRGFGEAGHDFLNTQRAAPNIVTNLQKRAARGLFGRL